MDFPPGGTALEAARKTNAGQSEILPPKYSRFVSGHRFNRRRNVYASYQGTASAVPRVP